MKAVRRARPASAIEPVRILGRGLRARRGVRLTLRVLREAVGMTQAEVAATSGMDQADVSRLERRADFGDCQVDTLSRYLEALGGDVDLVAAFGERRISLVGAIELPTAVASPRRRRTGVKR